MERKVVGIIPARYKSSRFPGKPLIELNGVPMVIRVAQRAAVALGHESVWIATDDQRIYNTAKKWGFNAVMTADHHLTGTDRVHEVAQKIEADYYVNIQGDEPLINPEDIKNAINSRKDYPDRIINGYTQIVNDDPNSVNIPKVVFDLKGKLLYMSRSAIPGNKKTNKDRTFYKQVCIYVFTKEELTAFSSCKSKTPLEAEEDIEILRFLEMGYSVQMMEMSDNSLAVDVPEDVVKVEKALNTLK
jgi:3-deoxy-manno-octulosonate cytidylyltransferase (CMP-KDO synthetase)